MSENPMSPFHAELLDFIKRDVTDRSKEEGFDPSIDVPLQNLQLNLEKALSPSMDDESLSFSEIIDNYQHLFGERGPIHIEKMLLEAFSREEFEKLGLLPYFPKIYRGLPRLYRRDHPVQSRIKKNFTHLPTLKALTAERALFSLYSRFEMDRECKISLFTWVIPDGLGDYIASLETAALLKERFPHLNIQLIALVSSRAASLPSSDPFPIHSIRYEEEPLLSLIPTSILEELRSSDLILQIPTFYPFTEELVLHLNQMETPHPMPKMESLGEYGFLESNWFHPKSGNRSMGLHFLEKGIFTRKAVSTSFADVENERLLNWIFKTKSPEKEEIDRYLKTHRFYLAYLSTPIGGATYLHALLKSLEMDERPVDLCVPDMGWFVQYLEIQNREMRPVLEGNFSIQTIEVYFQELSYSISIGPIGKTLRILCPGSISNADFRRLISLSGDFVGVRGNQSFSEAISAGKAFFYDGREHARYLIKDLLALAENRIASHPGTLACFRSIGKVFLHNLPSQGEDWVDETFFQEKEPWPELAIQIGSSLQNTDTLAGYKKLNRIIALEYSCSSFLTSFIQRALCHRMHPELERIEAAQMALFSTNAETFTQMFLEMKEAVHRILK
ncbi:MAG: hypothetical protein V4487_04000 [Chlamydiota bacterium]